jgi:hypothetical protein
VVTDRPQHFGTLREKLSMVTSAWFAQRYVEISHWIMHIYVHALCMSGNVIRRGMLTCSYRDFSDVDILKVLFSFL